MALLYFDDDPWTTAHDACEKLCRDIQSQILIWNGEPRSSANYGSYSANIRQKLKQYDSEIIQLKNILESSVRERTITDAERERRSRQIELLQSRYVQLQNQFIQGVQTSTSREPAYNLDKAKQELFGQSSGRSANKEKELKEVSTVNWGTGSDDDDELLDNDNSQQFINNVRKNQYQLIKDQDKSLDELSRIIARQRDIADTIGNEVISQNEIISDLIDSVDRTDTNVHAETGQIRAIDRKDNTCRYWTIIIILFIAIIIVAIV